MTNLTSYAATMFIGFFAIMTPVANTPIFLGMIDGMSHLEKRSIALRSTTLAFLIVTVFCLLGRAILDVFGTIIPAFRITEGILLFLIGKEMLTGHTHTHRGR